MLKKLQGMPRKLVAVLVMMVGWTLVFALTGEFFYAAAEAALLVGVLVGNDVVRRLIVWFAWFELAVRPTALLLALVMGLALTPLSLVFAAVGIAQMAFYIWVFTRDDVRRWMFATNMGLESEDELLGA